MRERRQQRTDREVFAAARTDKRCGSGGAFRTMNTSRIAKLADFM